MDRNTQFLALYHRHRYEDQRRFYEARRAEFEAAHGQAVTGAGALMVLTALAAAMASIKVGGPPELWAILGVVLPALSTALAAYRETYAFERQAKLYDDAVRALVAAEVEAPEVPVADQTPGVATRPEDLAGYVAQIEGILQKEQGQWGQLVSQIKPIELPAAPKK